VAITGNGSTKVEELTHTDGTYHFRIDGDEKAFFEVYLQLTLAGYHPASHSFNFTVAFAATEIADSSVANVSTIYLRFSDVYPFWLLWNDTNNNALIEDLNPGISEPSYVTLAGQPASGNHSFLFTATELGSFLVTITLDVGGYQAQQFVLTVEVEANPTILSAWTLAPDSEQDVDFSGSFAFSFTWEDTNHSVPIEGAAVSSNESTYVSEGVHSAGIYFFIFTASTLGSYGVNITLTKIGYDALSYQVTFYVVKSATGLASWRYANDSAVPVAYGDTVAFWLVWKDTDHDAFITDASPQRMPPTYLSFESSDAATGNHSFQFVHTTERTPGSYAYTIILNETGYEPLVYQITFEVLVNPTQITNWANKPINETSMIFGQASDFWLVWTDINHTTSIAEGSVTVTGNGSTKVQELTHTEGTYQFRFNANEQAFFEVCIQLTLVGYSPTSHCFNFTVVSAATEIVDSSPANETTLHVQYQHRGFPTPVTSVWWAYLRMETTRSSSPRQSSARSL
jgi:hypothetical protein